MSAWTDVQVCVDVHPVVFRSAKGLEGRVVQVQDEQEHCSLDLEGASEERNPGAFLLPTSVLMLAQSKPAELLSFFPVSRRTMMISRNKRSM
jgi:hypothetical protein